MTSNRSALGLAALVVGMAALGTVAFAGSAAAATNASLTADPADPAANSTHTATITVGTQATGSLNGFAIDYSNTSTNVSGVGQNDIATIGIDRGDDADGDAVDVNVSDDLSAVSTSNNGGTLTLTLGGSYSLNQSDEVVVVVQNVTNPTSEGDYDVPLDVNPQSSGGEATATLSITSATDGTTTTADMTTEQTTDDSTTADATTEDSTTESTDSGTQTTASGSNESANGNGTTTESGGTPGFGLAAALLALLAVGALALRRD